MPAATEPPARVSAPPASTVTTWWPFRPGARTVHDPASRPRIGAYQAERHEPIAIPPAGPAPGPCALHRATECSWIRSRPRPASPALANKSVPHGCNRAAVSLAPSESVPRGTRAVSPPRAVRWALQRPAHPTFHRAERPAAQPSESQRAGSDHPTSQHRGPSSRARPSALHRATASARVPIPTQARASATGGGCTGQHISAQIIGNPGAQAVSAQAHRPSVPQAHGPSVPPPPGLATSVQASGPRGPKQSGTRQTHAHRTTVPFRKAARPNGLSQVSQCTGEAAIRAGRAYH